jgi:hypothetical protein
MDRHSILFSQLSNALDDAKSILQMKVRDTALLAIS